MSAPGLIVFDCDGVLVDSEPLAVRVLVETLAEAGVRMDVEEAYGAFLGRSLGTVCQVLRDRWQVDVDAAALQGMRERLYRVLRRELQPMPGMAETLAALDVPYCVASSSQLERVALQLEVTGLSSFFGGNVFCAAMVERGKPAPDLFLHAARRMQVEPGRCIVVEDSPVGISAALNAGMTALGFVGGSHARSERHRRALEALGPRLVFGDMRELPALVRSQ